MLLYLLLGLPRIKGDDVAAYVDAFPSPIPHCDMRGLPPAAAPGGAAGAARLLRLQPSAAERESLLAHAAWRRGAGLGPAK